MTRAEHLQWCKDRALGYVDAGDNQQAFTSMVQDVGSHPANEMGMSLLMAGHLATANEMSEFINGYN